jgi:hypothetical protein
MPSRASAPVKLPLSTTLAKTRILSKRSTRLSDYQAIQNGLFSPDHIIKGTVRVHSTRAEETLERVIRSLFANPRSWVRRFWPESPSPQTRIPRVPVRRERSPTPPAVHNRKAAVSRLSRPPLRRASKQRNTAGEPAKHNGIIS